MASDYKLGADHRNPDYEYEEKIHDQESTTSVSAGLKGESPDVAQPYGRTNSGSYHPEAGGKFCSFFHFEAVSDSGRAILSLLQRSVIALMRAEVSGCEENILLI